GHNALPDETGILGRGTMLRFSLVDRIGDVSYFHDNDNGYLATLGPKADASLELARARGMSDRSTGIWDAVPDGDHWFLSASHTGLYRVHLPDGRARPINSPHD